jgi:F5/8 type C domain/Hypothetical glycosyl hydrolase family 15
MPSLRTAPTAVVAVILAVLCAAPAAAQTSPGAVHFAKAAESDFDVFTSAPTDAQKTWMRAHYDRMRAYSPYFDSRLSWFSNAWAYQDLYAIYRTSSIATQHPEWILKDSAGDRLYIPFGCSGGTCPQYAADPGNASFRSWWIQSAAANMAKGYRGLFVDDVNMDWRVGSGSGASVAPQDPRTGTSMTLADWRRYMAEFTEQIRTALPAKEIVHNAIWFANCGSAADSCWSDPYIRRELLAADYIELERGVNDAGITGGLGRYGYETFINRVDWLHAQGRAVVYDSKGSTAAAREYGLATYYLTSTGRDLLGNDPGGTPNDWWAGYDVQLGDATSVRYSWNGLFRRDFQYGSVLVNQPGATSKTVALGATYTDVAGVQKSSVTLGPASGAVLRGAGAPAPAPAPAPPPPPPPTTVEKASGRPATASSTEKGNYGAPRGVDRNRSTRWSSVERTGEWWQVDLGRTRAVDSVELDWERAYAPSYRIMTSTDGVNFSLAAAVTTASPGLKRTTFAARGARYVRIVGLARVQTDWGISFWEARVYGAAD